jgi:primary-amine oxidase
MIARTTRICAGSPASSRRGRSAARATDARRSAMTGLRRWRAAALGALALVAACGVRPAAAAAVHPLDPLDAGELATIEMVLKRSGRFSDGTNFAWVRLQEPAKALVQAFRPGMAFPRRAALDAIDYAKKTAFAVVVDVKAKQIVSVTDLGGLQPGLTERDSDIATEIIDADPRIKAALIARGLQVPGKVSDSVGIQFAPVGDDSALAQQGGRLMRVFFASDQNAVNEFSPFLDGLMAVVDVYSRQIVRFDDNAGVPAVHVPHDVFDRKVRGAPERARRTPRARDVRRHFSVERSVVTWRNWQFRYGFNLREGLVLYEVAVEDHGRKRPVLYRGSVSEILTAYGDSRNFWSWLELFDEGVFGIGASAVAVEPGREVPANALVLDPVLPDGEARGLAARKRHRVYIYERDGGNLLYYSQGDLTFHARPTELVIGTIAGFGNYAYGLNWVFKQDGSFAFEVTLAGQVLTKFVPAIECAACKAAAAGPGPGGERRTYAASGAGRDGTLVYPNLIAANHQHWFNLRLDFDIDGAANAVMENNLVHVRAHGTERGTGDEDAAGGRGFSASHTVFGRAADAGRDMNDASARTWTVYNPAVRSREGRPSGYTIAPMENTMTIIPSARAAGEAGFTFHHLWVTPFRQEQLYAAGTYPNQTRPDYTDTLAHYAREGAIYDKDIVVWYSLGMTHFPRVEDYPIMSSDRLAVTFRPDGFFARNRALPLGEVSGR